MVRKRGRSKLQPVGKILKHWDWDGKKYLSHEWQEYAYRLALWLGDMKHKSLFMKLAKETPRQLMDDAWNFVKDASNVKNKGKLFMWKLKELKKENKDEIRKDREGRDSESSSG